MIKTGDVLLVATSSWLGRTIRKVTKSEWSHAGIFIWLWGELFVIEAEKHGIQLTKWSDPKYNNGNPKGRKLKYLTPKVAIDEKEVARFMLPFVGTKSYDYMGLVAQLVYQWTGKWLGKKNRSDKRFYCSEFVAYVYHHINANYFNNWYEIDPGSIYDPLIFDVI